MRNYGLKLSPNKFTFFSKKVKYVGHIVSTDGVEPNANKSAKVKNWSVTSNLKEARQMIGFAGYYRKFIQDFAMVAKLRVIANASRGLRHTENNYTTHKLEFLKLKWATNTR